VVVIFGWGAESKDLGEVAPATCPTCRNDVFMHHVRSEKRVSLYFIPLVPYGTNEYLACPICKQGLEIPPQHRNATNDMRSATRVYRRGGVTEAYYLATVQAFWRRLGTNPTGQQVVQPPAAIPSARGGAPNVVPAPGQAAPSLAEQLAGLAELHAQGVLTDEEFAATKRRLIGG
jgi:uncharacterized protein YbaR (Trm112 family)